MRTFIITLGLAYAYAILNQKKSNSALIEFMGGKISLTTSLDLSDSTKPLLVFKTKVPKN